MEAKLDPKKAEALQKILWSKLTATQKAIAKDKKSVADALKRVKAAAKEFKSFDE